MEDIKSENDVTGLEIAVVGQAGRFPGAKNIETFWQNLKNGIESISFFSDQGLSAQSISDEMLQNPNYIKAKGVLEGIEHFDHEFFGYSYGEADVMDPQLRVLHECCWEALECAGYDPEAYKGLIGFYAAGDLNLSWIKKFLTNKISYAEQMQLLSLNSVSALSTRISYNLNLKGPSYTLNTACSSSLVAIHVACQALLNYECDMALAGGVCITLPKKSGYLYQKGMVASPDGHCRSFDEKAEGTVPGNGCGIVVLKRLEDAIKDGDFIYAIVKGSAINNDGSLKAGYTAPSIEGQAKVIKMAQQMAEVSSESISYVEAHGTGTVLGDPIEIEGLKLGFNTNKKQYCGIGSVKSNIGHLDTAAGVAGFIKTVLCLQHKLWVPSLNYENSNPNINFEESPFFVNQKLTPSSQDIYPLRAGVSSFGIGGTNAHAILEAYEEVTNPIFRDHNIITISARTHLALNEMTENLIEFLTKNKDKNISDIAYTLQVGRKDFSYRRALVASTIEDVIEQLTINTHKNVINGRIKEEKSQLVFMFPGQGAQYVNMSRELYERNGFFRSEMDHCLKLIKPILEVDIKQVLFPDANHGEWAHKRMNEMHLLQPIVFIIEYALARLLMHWGLSPTTMIGYSSGEYVVACLSGVFSLEDALKIITIRGKLLDEVPKGSMISVPLSEEHVKPFLTDSLSISVDNGDTCIVSGTKEAIQDFEARLKQQKYICMRLDNLHIAHSKAVDCILERFRKALGEIQLSEPKIKYMSSMTGYQIQGKEVTKIEYWVNHLRKTVRFTLGIETLLKAFNYTFVEVGPGRDLSMLVNRCANKREDVSIISTLPPKNKVDSAEYFLFKQVARLWSQGFQINWNHFNQGLKLKRIPLPTYSFAKTPFDIQVSVNVDDSEPVEKRGNKNKIPMAFSGTVQDRSKTLVHYKAPTNEREQILAKIIQEMFKVSLIGIDEDFFELGGDSLKATILVSKIHEKLNVELPVHEIFNHPTIEGMSKLIAEAKESTHLAIQRLEERPYYETSSAQKRMWLLQQLDPKSTGYNNSSVIIIEGLLNKRPLELAFAKLVERHEALRTSFEMVDGELIQRIAQKTDFKITYFEAEEKQVDEIIEDFIRPFELNKAPLIRIGLIKINQNKHFLLFDMHHIITDGMSIVILTHEFIALYEGHELTEQQIRYQDFSHWQNQFFKSEKFLEQEKYWLKQFSDEIPFLSLPLDYPRSATRSSSKNSGNLPLDPQLIEKLHLVSRETGATLYMILLSSIYILLFKYTNQEDIVIGNVIAGRSHVDLENIIGMFVNTLPLRNYPVSTKSYATFLNEVKESALRAYENQDYPFEELVSKLKLPRDLSRNPLFDVMFVLHTMDITHLELDGLQMTPYRVGEPVAQFDLTFNVMDVNDTLSLNVDYCTGLFSEETIKRLVKHWQKVLIAITDYRTVKIGEIDLLSKEERHQLLFEFNETDVDYPRNKTVVQLFEEQVAKTPNGVAVVFEEEEMTYEELNKRANVLAHELRDLGIGSDDYVAILAERSIEMVVGIYGIIKAGGAYVPIDPMTPLERVQYMLEDCRPKAVLTYQVDIETEVPVIDLKKVGIGEGHDENPIGVNQAEDLIYCIYTSGTTGKPKGVMIEHKNIVNYCQTNSFNIKGKYITDECQRIVSVTAVSFDIFVTENILSLLNGMTMILANDAQQKNPGEFSKLVDKHQVDVLQTTPSKMKLYLSERDNLKYLRHFKVILLGGEPYDPMLSGLLKGLDADVVNVYGPTETTVWSTATKISTNFGTKMSIGSPISNTQVYIMNEDMLCPIGVPGELCIAGEGVARGYLNQPKLTEEKFVQNPYGAGRLYRTGDLARWLPDGNLEFLGRIDDQVKIRGYRIELREIESRLLELESVEETVVMVKEGTTKDQSLCAYVVMDDEISSNELRQSLSKTLPHYMIPSYFVQLSEMPLSSNGKIDRKALPEPDSSSSQTGYVAPRNTTEEVLARIWGEVLNKKDIGINDNFFDLGGHSLKATVLINKINTELDVYIPLAVLYMNPYIANMMEYISSVKKSESCNIEGLILLKENTKTNKNLFFVHSGSGRAEEYLKLVTYMNDNFNYWGINYEKPTSSESNRSLDELAAQYVKKIKKIQEKGPYYISGWSLGGVIVFEMARQLEVLGDEVKFLGLYDAPALNDVNSTEFDKVKWQYELKGKLNAKISYFSASREREDNRLIAWEKRSNIDIYSIDATHQSMFENDEDIKKLVLALMNVLDNLN